ncbi:MAG TPA: hypothetical protein VEG26_09905 [Steroidobacteraceae bacterium]|nr:hypothetical protein [Steroidobacteraceae bacterium]
MNLARNLTFAAASSLLALAGCASTAPGAGNAAQRQLASSAQILDDNARVLAARADGETAPGFALDAHELEQHAYDLRVAARSGRASEGELRADFDEVTRSYQALRDDVQRLDTQQAHADLALVNDAYHGVASRMASVPASANAPGS